MNEFKVGQKVWDGARWLDIVRVGRKWVTCKCGSGWREYRFDKTTMRLESQYTMGLSRIYLTKEEHDQKVYSEKVWKVLRNAIVDIGYRSPKFTTPQIEAALTALGVPLPEHPSAEKPI